MVSAGGGGAGSFGGDPVSALVGLVLIVVIGIVVWKVLN